MADDNVLVNLEFRAVDNASRVTDDMIRRAQQGAMQIEAAFLTRMRAIEAMAKRQGVAVEEMLKRVEANEAKVGAAVDQVTEKTKKGTKAQEDATAATKKHASATQDALGSLGRYAAGFLTVQTAIQQAQKAMTTFADNERSMQRTTSSMRLTAQESEKMKTTFVALGKETGDSIKDLNAQFARLGPSTGLYGQAAVNEFVKVRQAAHAMGADIEDVMQLRGLMTRLKVLPEEMAATFDGLKTSLPPHLVGPFTNSVNQIMPEFDRLKIGGSKAILDMAAMYRASSGDFADPNAGFGALQKAITASFDPFTTLGLKMRQAKEELQGGLIDMPTYVSRMRETMADAYKGDDVQKKLQREFLMPGGEAGVFEAVDIYAKATDKIREEQRKQADSQGAIEKERAELFAQAKAQNDSLVGSLDELYDSGGRALNAIFGDAARGAISGTIALTKQYYDILFGLTELVKKGGAPAAAPAAPALAAPPSAGPPSVLRIPGRAAGGPVEPGQPYVVGEEGPEVIRPRERGEVLTADQSQRYGDLLAGQQGKADTELRSYLAGFRDKGRQMERLSMLDARPGADLGGGAGAGAGGGRSGGGSGGGGDPASGTRTGTGTGGGGQSSGTGPAGTGDTAGKMPVGVDPASATGPAENLEDAYSRGYLARPASGGLAGMRAGFASELAGNPQLQQRFLASVEAEVGGQGAAAKQAFMESVMNRAANRGLNMNQAVHDKSFFPSMTLNKLGRSFSGETLASLQKAQSDVLGGSDITRGSTGNYSVDRGRGWGPSTVGQTGVPGLSGGETTYVTGRGEYLGKEGVDLKLGWERKYQAALKSTGQDPGAPPGSTVADLQRRLQGPGDEAAPGAPLVAESQSRVAAIRRQPIDPQLKAALQYAAEKSGLRVNVTSGGQASSGPNRTGSHRHDHGNAADLDLVDEKGHAVARNDPRRLKFMEEAAAAGAGGTGAGYMSDPLKVHIGTTGSAAVKGQGLGAYAGNDAERQAVARGVKRYNQDQGILARRAEAAKAAATQVAGPAAVSDVETRAKARYQSAAERHAGRTGGGNRDLAGDLGLHTLSRPRTRSVSAEGLEDRASGKGLGAGRAAPMPRARPVARKIAAPGQESRAAGKGRPAPVARPVSAEGHEERAAGKGVAPVAELAGGGSADAGSPYIVGEQGPELFTPAQGGNVTSNGNLQAMMQGMRDQMERPIEPVIRPRFQHMGASSARWTRTAERSRELDNTRRAARESHTDQGFA